jgi:DNA-binding NtrC family response regulator
MTLLAVLNSAASDSTVEVTALRAGWNMVRANSYEKARVILSEDPPEVIICEAKLADGSWQGLLEYECVQTGSTLLIVTARLADAALWAEVLNLGGYDVLPQPFDEWELMRILQRRGETRKTI